MVGLTIFVIVFYGLGIFIDWTFLTQPVSAWNISVIHTGFTLAATTVLLPLNSLLVKTAYVVIPREETPPKQELLDKRLLATPAVAVQRTQQIAAVMAADAAKAMHLAIGMTKKFDAAVMEEVSELEGRTDRWEGALGTYLVKLSSMHLTLEEAAAFSSIGINKLRKITSERNCDFVFFVGNKGLSKRKHFGQYLDRIFSL